MRRAKIICTIGPAVHSPEAVEQLILYGMDAARLNFSHGSYADHAQTMVWLREASERLRKPVAIIADLQGPKIRTGATWDGKPIALRPGQRFMLTTDPVAGTAEHIAVTYAHLPEDVKPGDRILLDDGLLELRVVSTDMARNVETEVVVGGPLGEHKGINLPGVALRTTALTEKDEADLHFALAQGVDYIALSFVRRADDITLARQAMQRAGRTAPLIAKIEKPEALTNLDAILTLSDAVMVARGDLGVELEPERVPVVQKEIIRRCNRRGLPVIIATQMLNSMIEHPRPTRAEASDVANAVFDGADAVMLSGETASGAYPFEAVKMMVRIVLAAEEQKAKERPTSPPEPLALPADFPEVTCGIACRAAREAGAMVIAAFTMSGLTARLLSRFRPIVPVVAFSPDARVQRQLALFWGVIPRTMEPVTCSEALVRRGEEELLAGGFVRAGDRVVLVFGAPIAAVVGQTNSIRLHQIEPRETDVTTAD
ncbi:MAG TPA: pyruvate kinase [Methylomirabilota bacterium]|jgi:pyruvate kinase|nr:pyruvate kinase [Methylomirabilota bacterium]